MSSKRHIFAELPENKGIWVYKQDDSQTDYRKNGHKATLGEPGRCTRYRTPKRILSTLKQKGRNVHTCLEPITKHSPQHIERYYFDYVALYIRGKLLGQAIPNFLKGGSPYANEAHHLIPQAKYLALFAPREAAMLKRVDYNVHNGRNIIFLPKHKGDCGFHNLPYHSGPHEQYSTRVESSAHELSQKLRELADEACAEEELLNIKKLLMALQEEFWTLLSNAGPIAIK
ncbi:AHH domain-containing protein [Hyalangium rubrum]|uniref:AHH domain-containing protein n=1 Tax=Hyalangium rubrum TaxID=3103134 RepID=A0ABU5HDM5_9BACT|nr:AHH domain-containing protein [Hyalangium sp. s54d21]MDY7230923.1 AHH domain-containing protein [Hyalangium sp. s54d21]